MPRILFFVFLAFLFWLAIRLLGTSRKRRDDAGADAPPAEAEPRSVETVAQCAWCGVHVPHGAAVALPDGRVYCGDAHRDAAGQVAAVDRTRS
jgi:hypothetical protein